MAPKLDPFPASSSISNIQQCLELMKDWGLNRQNCPKCGHPIPLRRERENFQWNCNRDGWKRSFFADTSFAQRRYNTSKFLIMLSHFVVDDNSNNDWGPFAGSNVKSVVNFTEKALECLEQVLSRQQVGGPGVYVEVGNTLFDKEGSQEGFYFQSPSLAPSDTTRGHFVFGGVDRNTRKAFAAYVPSFTQENIQAILADYVAPESIIITDGRQEVINAARARNLGVEIVQHGQGTSIADTGFHTQAADSLLAYLKGGQHAGVSVKGLKALIVRKMFLKQVGLDNDGHSSREKKTERCKAFLREVFINRRLNI